ncbi:MAG: flagellar motor switch protein FliG [Candidatus Latescibacteria bacterium]|jgi:flagellar motor switch protein FliG|nr:flagellar motor switch protein FliG [Candidatus Latescibacterota bacterium]
MATQTKRDPVNTIVRSLGAADVPVDSDPSAWTPTELASRPASPPMDMRVGQEEEEAKAERARRAAAYVPEPDMVLVHAGEFTMGDDGPRAEPDERPRHTVLLHSYWIDRVPVTNAAYKAFVDATGHREPPYWIEGAHKPELADHPVTCVSWHDAMAYVEWAGKRLPTEAEWEKAARGTAGQTYPWGDAYRKDYVNSSNDYGGTTPVETFPQGASPYGVLDICGNVHEWCADWYYDEYYKISPIDNPTGPQGGQYHVLRGGYYGENRKGVRCAARHYAPPPNMQDHIGFRCVKDPVEPGRGPKDTSAEPARRPAERGPARPPDRPVDEPISTDLSMEQIATRRPDEVARVVRTLLVESGGESPDPSAKRKIATLVVGLGPHLSAGILKYCTDAEIEAVGRSVCEADTVSARERNEVFDEIKGRLVAGDYLLEGGTSVTQHMIQNAVGPRKAQILMDRVTGRAESGFYMLRDIDPEHMVPYLAKEHPQTIALILTQISPDQAAGILDRLPEDMQVNVTNRMARMENIPPRILGELEETVGENLQPIIAGQIAQVGGPKAVADVLNRTARSTEKHVLVALDEKDSELGEQIRKLMFTFEDVARLTDREIQLLLREVKTKDLAIALKGTSDRLKERVFSNMSEEVGGKVKEEMEYAGPIRLSDVETFQIQIVCEVRKLKEAGQIRIFRYEEGDKFV